MNFLNKLERKYGRYAIKNLMLYIVAANFFVFLLSMFGMGNIVDLLKLDPTLILKGQVWRLVSFLLVPPNSSPIFILFTLYFYYLVGNGLEQEWGSFKFNFYYFIGVITTILASFISGGSITTATYLNLSLFLAFAKIYPDFEVLLFFILPIKIKYLGYFNWVFLALAFIVGNLSVKMAVLAALLNYFIFFGKETILGFKHKGNAYKRRSTYEKQIPKKSSMHKCCVCGITEKDDPNMEFRYCSKCSGSHEYCQNHLFSHEHIN